MLGKPLRSATNAHHKGSSAAKRAPGYARRTTPAHQEHTSARPFQTQRESARNQVLTRIPTGLRRIFERLQPSQAGLLMIKLLVIVQCGEGKLQPKLLHSSTNFFWLQAARMAGAARTGRFHFISLTRCSSVMNVFAWPTAFSNVVKQSSAGVQTGSDSKKLYNCCAMITMRGVHA